MRRALIVALGIVGAASLFVMSAQGFPPEGPGAVAPGPGVGKPVRSPYVIVRVSPPASVRVDTVIVLDEIVRMPLFAVVYPAWLVLVDGELQPVGTVSVTAPPERPPASAV